MGELLRQVADEALDDRGCAGDAYGGGAGDYSANEYSQRRRQAKGGMAVAEKVGTRWVLRARTAGLGKGPTTVSQEAKVAPPLLRGTMLPQQKAREKLNVEALGG